MKNVEEEDEVEDEREKKLNFLALPCKRSFYIKFSSEEQEEEDQAGSLVFARKSPFIFHAHVHRVVDAYRNTL